MEVPAEIYFKGLVDSKAEAVVAKESKKRSLIEIGMNENEIHSGLDLELKLSPPGSSPVQFPTTLNSTEPSLPSLATLQEYLSSTLNVEKDFGGVSYVSNGETPPLVVMGCARCFIHVMVSKSDPKCPRCTNSNLIDEFQVNHAAKKLKTSLN